MAFESPDTNGESWVMPSLVTSGKVPIAMVTGSCYNMTRGMEHTTINLLAIARAVKQLTCS